jgi:electron transport complex protein RnfE
VALALIGVIREVLGTGAVMGYTVLSTSWYTPNQLMVMAPGAFFVLGVIIAIFNALKGPEDETEQK